MKTALYRVERVDDPTAIGKAAAAPPSFTFVCTIRLDGRVVDEIRHANVGTLMRMKARLHPTATTVRSVFEIGVTPPPRVRALEEVFA